MKSLLLSILFISAISGISYAQTNTFPENGNVGIGTTNPSSKLQVSGTLSAVDLPNTPGASAPVIYGSVGGAFTNIGVSMNHIVENGGTNTYGMGLLTSDSYLTGLTEKIRITGNGNVGIGTITPDSKLQVTGTLSAINLLSPLGSSTPVIYGSIGGGAYANWGVSVNHVVESQDNNTYGMGLFTSDSYLTGRTEKIRIAGNGNVGIGTTTPNSKLQVSGTLSAIDLPNTAGSSVPVIYGSIGAAYTTTGISMNHVVEDGGMNTYGMAFLTADSYLTGRTEKLRIAGNGNVGIGTTTPDARLAVNGTIHSKEVKVDSDHWPDYVFKHDYELMPLTGIKTYIEQNHHLPEMPPASEIEKKGMYVGEMNKLLTKKVEELTLYLIEKDAEVNYLKSDVKSLEKKYNDQQEQLNTMKSILNTMLLKSK